MEKFVGTIDANTWGNLPVATLWPINLEHRWRECGEYTEINSQSSKNL